MQCAGRDDTEWVRKQQRNEWLTRIEIQSAESVEGRSRSSTRLSFHSHLEFMALGSNDTARFELVYFHDIDQKPRKQYRLAAGGKRQKL